LVHREAAVERAGQKDPAGQVVHAASEAAPGLGRYLPAGQGVWVELALPEGQ